MFIFGVTVVLYFIKILSDSRNLNRFFSKFRAKALQIDKKYFAIHFFARSQK
jgi:hypothetical protein